MRVLLLILVLACAGRLAHAEEIAPAVWEAQQSAECAAGLKQAEAKYGIPHGLLATMAKVESGRPLPGAGLQPWPWTIDADGQGYFFQSKAAAIAWAEQAKDRGVRLMDVGCMQVNLQYHPNAFASLDQAFDPVANADYAARFLKRLKEGDAGGNWFTAVGFYHSQTPVLAAAYRQAVTDVAAGRSPSFAGMSPLYMRSLRQGAVLLTFANGHVTTINTSRQPSRRHRKMSACQIAAVLGDYLSARPRGCGR
jgi:hypothetical protein